jgi:histidine phosphotransfer protein HptB
MPDLSVPLIDWVMLEKTRRQLGVAFIRIYGYFREDAETAITAIENAIRTGNGAAMINPASALRDAAEQMGAERLTDLAEEIEMHARGCVEAGLVPDDYIDRVAALRPLLAETLSEVDAEVSPLVQRGSGFGRRQA